MARAFQYKPKFVDIRVRPPSANDASETDVNALKPGERACDHPGCGKAATARESDGLRHPLANGYLRTIADELP